MTIAASAQRPERRSPTRRVSPRSERRAGSENGAPAAYPAATIHNRQQTRAVNLPLLRAVMQGLFSELPLVEQVELGIFLVAAPEMTRLNETFLQHAGSTDVITFDYADHASASAALRRGKSPVTHPPPLRSGATSHASRLHGEIFICVDEAIAQAHRFRTTWQAELVRYLVHGVLHLLGHDDRQPSARRKMKRAEDRLLRSLATSFAFSELARPTPRRSARKS